MFIIVRYLGMVVFVITGLFGTRFIPGPPLMCTTLLLVSIWGFVLFLAAADIVMILRVYAMYNQSKVVLSVLLVFYVSTIILYFASAGYYNNPSTYLTMDVVQLLDMSFCEPTYSYPSTKTGLGLYKVIPRLGLAGLLLLLVVSRVGWDVYQGYRATRRWRVNRYLNLLAKEGILYFVVHIMYNIDFGLTDAGVITTTIVFVLMYVLSPRFIMNVRELHLRSILWQSASIGSPIPVWDNRDMGIDTGFGLSKSYPPQLQVDAEVEEDLDLPAPSFTVTDSGVEMQTIDESRSSWRV